MGDGTYDGCDKIESAITDEDGKLRDALFDMIKFLKTNKLM